MNTWFVNVCWVLGGSKTDVINPKIGNPTGNSMLRSHIHINFISLALTCCHFECPRLQEGRKWALGSDAMKCVHPHSYYGTCWNITSQLTSKSHKVDCPQFRQGKPQWGETWRLLWFILNNSGFSLFTWHRSCPGNPRCGTSLRFYLEPADEVVSCEQLVEDELKGVVSAGLIKSKHVKGPLVDILRVWGENMSDMQIRFLIHVCSSARTHMLIP